jgi:hypothetical protein
MTTVMGKIMRGMIMITPAMKKTGMTIPAYKTVDKKKPIDY